jgi:hypothetical protein
VIAILRGSFCHTPEIEVPSGRVDLRPPKIIAGISLTLLGERGHLPQGVITLPAILDTGFNRILEIDEWHLVKWAGIHKEHLDPIETDKSHEGRKYDLCRANLWLHRTPYAGPRRPGARSPILLRKSTHVRVMAPIGKPNPRLPLLGLTALIAKSLRVSIDGENSHFRISKSLRSTISDLYGESLTERRRTPGRSGWRLWRGVLDSVLVGDPVRLRTG